MPGLIGDTIIILQHVSNAETVCRTCSHPCKHTVIWNNWSSSIFV